MNKWNTWDFKDFYYADINIQEKANKVISFIKLFLKKHEEHKSELEYIIEWFGYVGESDDEEENIIQFDNAMAMLYDFADAERIWIETI